MKPIPLWLRSNAKSGVARKNGAHFLLLFYSYSCHLFAPVLFLVAANQWFSKDLLEETEYCSYRMNEDVKG